MAPEFSFPGKRCFLPDIPSNIYTQGVTDGGFCKHNQDPKNFEFKKDLPSVVGIGL